MTTADTPAPPAPIVKPAPDSRLEQLVAQFDEAKKLAEKHAARLNELKDAIKSELANAAPGAEKVLLHSDYLDKPLQMSYRTEWRLDSKRLKAEAPRTWVEYAKQGGSWRLEQSR